jgi:hypothetical protein
MALNREEESSRLAIRSTEDAFELKRTALNMKIEFATAALRSLAPEQNRRYRVSCSHGLK